MRRNYAGTEAYAANSSPMARKNSTESERVLIILGLARNATRGADTFGAPRLTQDFDGVAVWGEMAATNLRLPSVSIATSFIFEVFRGLEGGGEFWRYMRSFWLLFPNLVAAWVRMNAAAGTRSL
ncbi:MAG: hypothetical protein ACTHOR_19095, partial [Devosia sp.]